MMAHTGPSFLHGSASHNSIGEHAWGGQFNVGQGPQMVEHGTPIAIFLGIVNKGADVLLLAVIGDSRADDHGDIISNTVLSQGLKEVESRSGSVRHGDELPVPIRVW